MKIQDLIVKNIGDIPTVEEAPVRVLGKNTDYKAIVNSDKETVSIVSKNYQLVQHRDIWKKIHEMKQLKVKDAVIYRDGKVLLVELAESRPKKLELLEGDYMTRRIRIFNSYDLTHALSVQSYGVRLVCTNGMIAPAFTERFRGRHTYNSINIGELNKYIKVAFEVWATTNKLFKKAEKTIVPVKDALKYMKYLPKKYQKIIIENLNKKENVYVIWNESTRTIAHDMTKNMQTASLVRHQRQANNLFKILKAEDEPAWGNRPLPPTEI